MKNTYKNIKQGIKKYVAPAVIGLSMAGILGGCGNDSNNKTEFPINQETKNVKYNETLSKLDSLYNVADSLTYDATQDFNKGVKKGELDSVLMNKGLSDLEKASELYSNIGKRAKAQNIEKYQNVAMDSSAKELMNDYDKTLNGWDTGKAELEKKLEKQGHEVDVYNPVTIQDQLAKASPFIVGGSFLLILAAIYDLSKKP